MGRGDTLGTLCPDGIRSNRADQATVTVIADRSCCPHSTVRGGAATAARWKFDSTESADTSTQQALRCPVLARTAPSPSGIDMASMRSITLTHPFLYRDFAPLTRHYIPDFILAKHTGTFPHSVGGRQRTGSCCLWDPGTGWPGLGSPTRRKYHLMSVDLFSIDNPGISFLKVGVTTVAMSVTQSLRLWAKRVRWCGLQVRHFDSGCLNRLLEMITSLSHPSIPVNGSLKVETLSVNGPPPHESVLLSLTHFHHFHRVHLPSPSNLPPIDPPLHRWQPDCSTTWDGLVSVWRSAPAWSTVPSTTVRSPICSFLLLLTVSFSGRWLQGGHLRPIHRCEELRRRRGHPLLGSLGAACHHL